MTVPIRAIIIAVDIRSSNRPLGCEHGANVRQSFCLKSFIVFAREMEVTAETVTPELLSSLRENPICRHRCVQTDSSQSLRFARRPVEPCQRLFELRIFDAMRNRRDLIESVDRFTRVRLHDVELSHFLYLCLSYVLNQHDDSIKRRLRAVFGILQALDKTQDFRKAGCCRESAFLPVRRLDAR